MRCPNCHRQVPFEKGLFRGARCKGCNVTLLVSQTYSRVLLLIALFAAEVLLWVSNARKLFYPSLGVEFGFLASISLGFPVAFFMLSVMVRTIPRFAPPTLVLRDWDDTITTLKLDGDHNDSNMTSGPGDR
jgi:hypothetical protein